MDKPSQKTVITAESIKDKVDSTISLPFGRKMKLFSIGTIHSLISLGPIAYFASYFNFADATRKPAYEFIEDAILIGEGQSKASQLFDKLKNSAYVVYEKLQDKAARNPDAAALVVTAVTSVALGGILANTYARRYNKAKAKLTEIYQEQLEQNPEMKMPTQKEILQDFSNMNKWRKAVGKYPDSLEGVTSRSF